MNRKASLNLSIEAIVIVVIAFTVLGLGLGFVKSQIGDIQKTSSAVQEQISQQILDDLRTGNKKLSFPAAEITLGKKESSVTAIGIKNTLSGSLDYNIEIERSLGGEDIFGATPEEVADHFLYTTDTDTLSATDTRVVPIRITTGTVAGTGQFKLTIFSVDEDGVKIPYDSKTFFITVTG